MWFGAIRVESGDAADRQPDRVPPVPDADPVRGPDRGVHVHPDPARGGLGRPDPGGPRDRARRSSTRASRSPAPSRRSRGHVEFRDVEFRYPGAEEPVLRGISFVARPGETTAIVGSTGSGKSTLINLIPRFYDATEGAVLVDGVDVRALDREDLWRRIGFVPQKAFLFSGTVASNLRFGDADATDDELWHALEIAQGRDFVEAMEGGLEAPITQGGTNVSGGQRQRLAIARALVKRAADRTSSTTASRRSTSHRRAPAGRPRAGARRRDRDHRRPARRHDHATPTGSSSSTPAGSSGSARTPSCCETNETYREIVYSQLSAGGGGGMTARPGGGTGAPGGPGGRVPRRRRPRRRVAGRDRGPGMMGMGPPVGQARRTSAARSGACSGSCGPERPLILVVLLLAVVSVTFAVIGPKILGEATNIIFAGVGRRPAPGRRDAGPGHRRAAGQPARTSSRTCSRA